MRIPPRNTRRTSTIDKENHQSIINTSSRKARHRLSTKELARLEDVFFKDTHPSRQQKKDLAIELGMDYKTVTVWFQNKRQTMKRGQPHFERLDKNIGRTRADSCLRSVSSPSLNATLHAFENTTTPSSETKGSADGLNIVAITPLLDVSNGLTPRLSAREFIEAKNEAPSTEDPSSENTTVSTESSRHDQTVEREEIKERSRWKRMRTLEWACERQTKRRKLCKEAHTVLQSEDVQDSNSDDLRMDSALSLLSLASMNQGGSSWDVMKGASLLLGFKHAWFRKQ